MKHILILISILLLSSPLFGQSKKSDLLYILENGSRYVGEWKDGKKHGQGTYTSGKGKGEGDKYVGEFKGGFKNGHGKYIWSDGDEYVGEFKDDKPDGQGTYTWSNGDKYVGEFKDGNKTFVTLQGNNLNSFGDATIVGTDGFQQSLLRSIYRSQRDKRELICSDYPKILEEYGGVVRKVKKPEVVKLSSPKKVILEETKGKPVEKTKPKKKGKWECIVLPCDFIDEDGNLIED